MAAPLVAGLGLAAYGAALRDYGIADFGDEGLQLAQAWRVSRGQLPYVDFHTGYGPLYFWMQGALVGKVGSVFCSTASQHGGQETTITSFHSTLLHHGMIVVGLPYTFKELTTMREVTGGTPYGASCVTGTGSETRMPTALELEMCRYQGEHVARITARLVSGSA